MSRRRRRRHFLDRLVSFNSNLFRLVGFVVVSIFALFLASLSRSSSNIVSQTRGAISIRLNSNCIKPLAMRDHSKQEEVPHWLALLLYPTTITVELVADLGPRKGDSRSITSCYVPRLPLFK